MAWVKPSVPISGIVIVPAVWPQRHMGRNLGAVWRRQRSLRAMSPSQIAFFAETDVVDDYCGSQVTTFAQSSHTTTTPQLVFSCGVVVV